MINRRTFLESFLASSAVAAAGGLLSGCQPSAAMPLLSAAYNPTDQNQPYSLRIFSGATVQQRILPLPARAHSVTLHPSATLAVCHDRRPGRRMYVIDLQQQTITRELQAQTGRHFFGHGVFSADGQHLYTTENDYGAGEGVIGIYRCSDWSREGELSAYGIGCHEIGLLPDGRTLVVANGGILTHPSRPREKLNLNTMRPNLAYVDRVTGRLMEQHSFGHHQLSIRHFDIGADGAVVLGMQYQGESSDIQPLVALHRRGQPIQAMNAGEEHWLGFSQYIASVALLSGQGIAATTSPRGHRVTFWNTDTRTLLASFALRDVAGAAVTGPDTITVSTGTGALVTYRCQNQTVTELHRVHYPDTGWDNHLTA